MVGFAATLELATLSSDGSEGFTIGGEAASDFFGFSVSAAGDVNGDGIDDFIIGAKANDTVTGNGGASYVVFGTAAGFPVTFDVSTLDGTNGFQISGDITNSNSGWSVAAAGDVNGDGVGDLLIGAPYGGAVPGTAYIVFGKNTAVNGAFAANLSVTALDGTNGFKIAGQTTGDLFGFSVASAGDINGDGIDDLVFGTPFADPNGISTGSTYVVFGKDTGVAGDFAASIALGGLDGTNGFKINGVLSAGLAGYSVASAGDVNGDGIGDLIIGARDADLGSSDNGVSYVVFGKDTATAGAFDATLELSALNGSNGFRIAGAMASERSGWSVASAGDVNGDGVGDLIIGASLADANGAGSGASYVVFGRDTASVGAFATTLQLSALDGTNGFRIAGVAAGDRSGISVASAGDVNGDGVGDLIIGARSADGTGASYVVFGKNTATDGDFLASLDLSSLDGGDGFKIAGVAAGDYAGVTVASAGDINQDGFDDLIVGAPRTDQLGSQTGSAYVILGHSSVLNFTGTAADESQDGGAGADHLSGLGGKDVLNGLGGNDTIDGGDGKDTLSGGNGIDTLLGGAGADILNGDAGDDILDGGSERDQLYGGDGNDSLTGGSGIDWLYGGIGNDSLSGGTEADTLSGGDGVDTLSGGDGNDILNGDAGADAMTGGAGDDIFYVDDAGDTVVEASGEGTDLVHASVSFTLGANVERLVLDGSGDIAGTGNSLGNVIEGNSGANTLDGGAGDDLLRAGLGADTLTGGTGNDIMTGGTGADTFVITDASIHLSGSGGGALELDSINDLSQVEGDRLDLSAIDADTVTAGDQAFHLVGGFTHHAGEMALTYVFGVTLLQLDVDGDGHADYQMRIAGNVTGDSGGWVL